MFKYCLFILFIFLCGLTLAQKPDTTILPANKAKIAGRVVDANNKLPIEFATVKIFNNKNKLVDGIISNDEGFFTLLIDFGSYRAEIDFIGYKRFLTDSFKLDAKNNEKILKGILLQPSINLLKDVEIIAQKDLIENKIDRKVYNVGKDLTAVSGTAANVLQNVPSVNFDSDGNLTMRGGANVTILINGRMSALNGSDKQALLNQIQATDLEKIEVITNPSASFDAEGTNGIINIITKKAIKPGIFGVMSLGAGTRQETNVFKFNKYNANASINYINKWIDYNASVNYNLRPTFGYGDIDRVTLLSNNRILNMNQNSASEREQNGMGARTSAEIYLNKKSTLFLNANINTNKNTNEEKNSYDFSNENNLLIAEENRNSLTKSNNNNYGLASQYKYEFDGQDHSIVFDINYEKVNNGSTNTINILGVSNLFQTIIKNNLDNNFVMSQLNYNKLFNKKIKLETGVKLTARNFDTDLKAAQDNGFGLLFDTLISNNLTYSDKNYAGFASISGDLKYFKYLLGLRGEFVNLNITTLNNPTFGYDIASLFPSLFLTKDLKKNNSIGISYARRIRRPDAQQLNPFPDYDDPTTLRSGNPFLKPEYINAFESTYNQSFNMLSLNSTFYYRFNESPINRVIRTDSTGITRVTFANIDGINNTGLDLSLRITLSKKINFTINENIFYSDVKSTVDNVAFSKKGVISNLKLNINYTIIKNLSAQINGNFNSRVFNAQAIISPVNSGSISVRYNFYNNKANITANYSDILYSQFFKIKVAGTNFETSNYRRRESRILFLTLTINLGKGNLQNEGKKKKSGLQKEENGGGFDGF